MLFKDPFVSMWKITTTIGDLSGSTVASAQTSLTYLESLKPSMMMPLWYKVWMMQSLSLHKMILLSDLADIRSNQLAFPWANRLYSIHFISWNCRICGKNIKRILLKFGVLFTHFFYVVNSPRKDTSENISLSYFKLIDLERTLELYDIFRLDFEMFNYSVIDYLNLFSQKVWHFEVTTTNILFSTKTGVTRCPFKRFICHTVQNFHLFTKQLAKENPKELQPLWWFLVLPVTLRLRWAMEGGVVFHMSAAHNWGQQYKTNIGEFRLAVNLQNRWQKSSCRQATFTFVFVFICNCKPSRRVTDGQV